jgi:hypothetical protein
MRLGASVSLSPPTLQHCTGINRPRLGFFPFVTDCTPPYPLLLAATISRILVSKYSYSFFVQCYAFAL